MSCVQEGIKIIRSHTEEKFKRIYKNEFARLNGRGKKER